MKTLEYTGFYPYFAVKSVLFGAGQVFSHVHIPRIVLTAAYKTARQEDFSPAGPMFHMEQSLKILNTINNELYENLFKKLSVNPCYSSYGNGYDWM